MAALKGLVIGMAVLLVAGFGLLAWGLYHKASDPDFKLFAASPVADSPKAEVAATLPPPAAVVGAEPFRDLVLPVPEACAIMDMVVRDERLFVRLGPTNRCTAIAVMRITDGTLLGMVKVPE